MYMFAFIIINHHSFYFWYNVFMMNHVVSVNVRSVIVNGFSTIFLLHS